MAYRDALSGADRLAHLLKVARLKPGQALDVPGIHELPLRPERRCEFKVTPLVRRRLTNATPGVRVERVA